MYNLLIKLMVLAAVMELGLSVKDIASCRSRACLRKVERASWKVLKIDWKPISVFPEEAKQFRR